MRRIALLFVCVLFVLTGQQLFASHEMGVDVTYECLSACTTRIHLRAYRDCTGSAVIANSMTWSASGCTPPAAITAWSTLATSEVTPICPATPTQCTTPGATINGVEEYHWYRNYDICTGTPCVYTLEWMDCCRNPSITSLTSAGSQSICTSGTTLNTALGTCNNSPVYTNLPLFYACQGLDYDVHQGAIDPDGDSLVFTMGTCYNTPGVPVTYASGYSQTAPLGPTWNVTLDPQTGILHLDANPGNIVVGVMCILVSEYRNGSLIGTTQRDIQIIILACGANANPTFGSITNLTGGATAIGDDVYLPAPGPLCFDLPTADVNAGQNLRLFWYANSTSATFTDATNGAIFDTISGTSAAPPTGRFCWTPPASGTYQFTFRTMDSFCPVYGFGDKIITVHVAACGGSTATATMTTCPDVQFSASTCMTGVITYTWSGGGGMSGSTASFNHTYAGAGSYPWQVIVSNGSVHDTIMDTVVVGGVPSPDTLVTGLHYVTPCTGQLYDTLTVNGSYSSYLWSTGATTASIAVFLGGTYGVTVTAANGCTYSDAPVLYWSEPDIYGVVSTSTAAPLQNQKVMLIQHDTTLQALWAVDSTWTDSLGYYYFCNVVDTLVFLKATPLVGDYPNEMPTYADTTLYWNNAITFYPLTQIPFQHDFSTLYGTNPGGPGFIGGLVSQGANKTGAVGDPIPGLRLFLRNSTGDILGYRITDVNGYFSFAGIPLGNYEIVPDRPNVSTTNVPALTLTAQTPTMDSLDFQLHRYWLELVPPATGIPAPGTAFSFEALPNPFGNSTRISLDLPADASVEMDLFDVTGKRVAHVFKGQVKKGKHRYEVGNDLEAGIYFVRLRINGEDKILKLLKVN